MNDVRMHREKLIERLAENRSKHIEEYATYVAAWREAVLRRLEDATAKLAAADTVEAMTAFDVSEALASTAKPQDHSEEYDRALAMLACDVRETIDLTAQEFRQLVLDDWSWKGSFRSSGIGYISENASYPSAR